MNNMTTVTIDGNRVSPYDAVQWAQKEFGHQFKINHEFPGWRWEFHFPDPKQASLFALKWV
jgi:hypothetical protein